MKGAILWKRILHEGIFGVPAGWDPDALRGDVIRAPIICVERTQGANTLPDHATADDAKSLSFPFPCFWVDFPLGVSKNHNCKPPFDYTKRCGNLVAVSQIKGGVDPTNVGDFQGDAPDDGFSLGILSFQESRVHNPRLVGRVVGVQFDNRGNLISDTFGFDSFSGPLTNDEAQAYLKTQLWITIGILKLLGCKNVSLQPHKNDPKQVRVATKRHGENPHGYHYHTLVVRPAGASKNTPPQEIDVMPLHMCRGHFAEYGEQFGKGKLFGKYEGRFYVPPHLKGNKDNGVVEKDYEVRAVSMTKDGG